MIKIFCSSPSDVPHLLFVLQPSLYLSLEQLLPPVKSLDLLLGPLAGETNPSKLVLEPLVERPHDPPLQPLLLPLLCPPLDEPPPLLLDPLSQLLLPLDVVDEVVSVGQVWRHAGVSAVRDGHLVAEPQQVVLELPGVLVHHLLPLHVVRGGLSQAEPATAATVLRMLGLLLGVLGRGGLAEVVRGGEDPVEGDDLLPQLHRNPPEVGRVGLQADGGGADDDAGSHLLEQEEEEGEEGGEAAHVLVERRAGCD